MAKPVRHGTRPLTSAEREALATSIPATPAAASTMPAKQAEPAAGESKSLKDKSPLEPVPVELQVIFGRNLKLARIKSGLKQAEVAELTGLPQQYLSTIELGQQNITLRTMELLAKVVDHDASAMIRRARDEPDEPTGD